MTRRVWAALVVVTVSLVYVSRLDQAAGLMIDDAWYIVLARALASGEGYRLISSATVPIMPVVPPGFPALLSPVFLLGSDFPDNLWLLKAISVLAMLGVGAATYVHLIAFRRMPEWMAVAVATATVLTPALVFLATSTVMAECAFTLAQILTVLLLDRGRAGEPRSVRTAALAGLLAAASVLLRSAGVAMLVAGGLYLLKERSWRRLTAFAGAAIMCLAPWSLYSSAHAPTAAESASHGGTIAYAYSDLLAMRRTGDAGAGRTKVSELPARVSRNLVNVFGRDVGGVFVPGFYRGPLESGEETVGLGGAGASMGSATATLVVSFSLSALLLLGLVVSVRSRMSAADVLCVVSVAMIALVPTRTFRYLLPLSPFLWLYLVTGLGAFAETIGCRVEAIRRNAASAVAIVLMSLVGLQLQDHAQYASVKATDPPVADWLRDARAVDELLAWMNTNLPAGAPVASTNPGLVYLRTGRKGVASADPAARVQDWKAAGIRYIVALQPAPLPAKSLGFRTLYESRRLWVVEI